MMYIRNTVYVTEYVVNCITVQERLNLVIYWVQQIKEVKLLQRET